MSLLSTGVLAGQLDTLMDSARLWSAKNRPDLAMLAVRKVLAADPGHPQALLMLAQDGLRNGHPELASEALATLQSRSADAATRRQLREMIRLAGPDGRLFATAQAMTRSGRVDEAIEIARRVFPAGPPGGDLSLQYYQILSGSPREWHSATAGFEALVAGSPHDPRYQLALANHLILREATRPRALRIFASMARAKQGDEAEVMAGWQRGINNLGANPAHLGFVNAYLAQVPGDEQAQAKRQKLSALLAEQRRLAAEQHDPAVQAREAGWGALERGDLASAESLLGKALAARPDDPRALGGLGRVKLRAGEHDQARALFARALAHDPNNQSEWRDLGRTASFWGSLKQARVTRESGNMAQADADVMAALELQPQQVDALALLAGIRADQSRPDEAEALYRRVLARQPDHFAAYDGLVTLLLAQGRQQDANVLLNTPAASPAQRITTNGIKASLLRHQADELVAQGKPTDAIALLQQAVLLSPADPWLAYDLAQLQARQGDTAKAEAVMAPFNNSLGLAADPGSRYAYALFQASLDRSQKALQVMQGVPVASLSVSMQRFIARLQMDIFLADSRQPTDATTWLRDAQALAGDDPVLNYRVAERAAALGWRDQAFALMANGRARAEAAQPASTEQLNAWLFQRLALLDAVHEDAELAEQLQGLEAHPQLMTDSQSADVRELRLSLTRRSIEKQQQAGQFEEARLAVTEALGRYPNSTDLRLLQAGIDVADGQTETALTRYRSILKQQPRQPDAELGIIDALLAGNDRDGARSALRDLESRIHERDTPMRLSLARRYARLKELPTARQLVAQQQVLFPTDASIMMARGNVEEDAARYTDAATWYARASAAEGHPVDWAKIPVEPAVTSTAPQRALSRLEKRRDGYIATATQMSTKSGTDGLSVSSVLEVPTEFYLPIGYDGHFIGHIDYVSFDAGHLPADVTVQRTFGKVLALAPAGVPTMAESEVGVALGVGFETDDYRFDIGTAPLGFPVANMVGGLKFYRSSGNQYSTLDIFRRAHTSSLLSYAGAVDPVTDEVWGGVVRTGVAYRVSHSQGARTRSFSMTGAQLTGRNVASNTEFRVVAGQNHDVFVRPNTVFNAGLTLTYWQFARDLSNFTFGQGGYYSPQTYVALNLPLRLTGRVNEWAYLVEGGVGMSFASSSASPYYPTRPALQAQAEANAALDPTLPAPVFGGSSGSSFSYSLNTALERRLTENLFVGFSTQLSRAPYYSPNLFQLFLRYELKPKYGPVEYPPRVVKPYSEF